MKQNRIISSHLLITIDVYDVSKAELPYTHLVVLEKLNSSISSSESIMNFSLKTNINNNDKSIFNLIGYKDMMNELNCGSHAIKSVFIAVNCWSECYINDLVDVIRNKFTESVIVLGGHSVDYNVFSAFPDIDYALKGPIDYMFHSIDELFELKKRSLLVENSYDINLRKHIYQKYSDKLQNSKGRTFGILISAGCKNNCCYCNYGQFNDKYPNISINDICVELDVLVNTLNAGKINMIDAVFSNNREYKKILETLCDLNYYGKISINETFTTFKIRYIDSGLLDTRISELNLEFEFGLQSMNDLVLNEMKTPSNVRNCMNVISYCKEKNISFSLSAIVDLPLETLESFKRTVDFIVDNDLVDKISFYPLTLFKGTELYDSIDKYEIEYTEKDGLKYVIESCSYTNDDYDMMCNYLVQRNVTAKPLLPWKTSNLSSIVENRIDCYDG